jgi:hypothetical protein
MYNFRDGSGFYDFCTKIPVRVRVQIDLDTTSVRTLIDSCQSGTGILIEINTTRSKHLLNSLSYS